MDKKYRNTDEILLYRGIDGRTGRQTTTDVLSAVINDHAPQVVPISESCLVGYSDDFGVAVSFGTDRRGIVLRKTIHKDDVISHPDFFSIGSEREFIVRNLRALEDVAVSDIVFIRNVNHARELLGNIFPGYESDPAWRKIVEWLEGKTLLSENVT